MIVHPTKVQNPDLGPITLLQSLPTSETRAFLNFPIFSQTGQAGENLTSGRARENVEQDVPAVAGSLVRINQAWAVESIEGQIGGVFA